MRKTLALAALGVLAAACGNNIGGDDDGTGGDGGAGGNGDGGGINEFTDAGPQSSCKHVDLVIAVDGSGSMVEELVAMRDTVFPAFATRLATIGDAQGLDDFRVGTLDACPTPANLHTRGQGGACNFQGGNPWIESISTAMNAEFACVGDIDTTSTCSGDNDDEQPASAVVAALTPPFSTNENAGFVRDEALLVVIAITDEDEQPTPNANAQEVYNRLVAIKGDVKRVVFLGIGGSSNCTGPYGTADQADKLRDVTNLFIAQGRGVWWDLCAGQLEDGLDEAFQVIQTACDELPPVL